MINLFPPGVYHLLSFKAGHQGKMFTGWSGIVPFNHGPKVIQSHTEHGETTGLMVKVSDIGRKVLNA